MSTVRVRPGTQKLKSCKQTAYGTFYIQTFQSCRHTLKSITIRHRFDKELGATLCALPLCEPLVLALDKHSRAVPQIHQSDRTDNDAFVDIVLDCGQTKPLGNLALERVRLLQAVGESPCEKRSFFVAALLLIYINLKNGGKTIPIFTNRQTFSNLFRDYIRKRVNFVPKISRSNGKDKEFRPI